MGFDRAGAVGVGTTEVVDASGSSSSQSSSSSSSNWYTFSRIPAPHSSSWLPAQAMEHSDAGATRVGADDPQ